MPAPSTLASLFDYDQRLEISCWRCPHKAPPMSPEDAVATFGAGMTFVRLRKILRCSECGAQGRDGHIDVRASTCDYYAALERRKYEEEVLKYGQAQADLGRSYRGRLETPPPADVIKARETTPPPQPSPERRKARRP